MFISLTLNLQRTPPKANPVHGDARNGEGEIDLLFFGLDLQSLHQSFDGQIHFEQLQTFKRTFLGNI